MLMWKYKSGQVKSKQKQEQFPTWLITTKYFGPVLTDSTRVTEHRVAIGMTYEFHRMDRKALTVMTLAQLFGVAKNRDSMNGQVT